VTGVLTCALPEADDIISEVYISKDTRDKDKPSDHVPIVSIMNIH
jgi:hypothetical protein